jgi:16S rRNA (uracil1498-N3)-methyltransferase
MAKKVRLARGSSIKLKSFLSDGMHRFFLPPSETHGDTLVLEGREAHHALHVLRVRVGESATVLDGEGNQFFCEIIGTSRHRLDLRVLKKTAAPRPAHEITLAQAVPKGKLLEDIIEKAVELGSYRVVPLLTARTIFKWNEDDQANKLAKWRLVAIEAIKQCGAPWLPRVEAPMNVEQFAAFQSAIDLPFVGSLANGARHPRTWFKDFERRHNRKPGSLSVAIGPEGDFTPEELSALETAGARPITLGPLVLRTDTAAAYCLSTFNYELQAPA